MEIVKLSPENFNEVVSRTAKLLKEGGVVVLPSDTVYGIAADFKNEAAKRRIFEIKKRPEEKILPVFVSSLEMAEELRPIANEKVREILKKFWPGKLTAVLTSRQEPGLRVPGNTFILSLIEALGGPLAETSANIYGSPHHTKIDELIAELQFSFPQPDLIVDAGDLPDSLPSTVVDFTVDPPKILREGAVSEEELQKAIVGVVK